MNKIKRLKAGQGNEIHVTDAIKNLITMVNLFMEVYLKESI